jgi:hypothetical protein
MTRVDTEHDDSIKCTTYVFCMKVDVIVVHARVCSPLFFPLFISASQESSIAAIRKFSFTRRDSLPRSMAQLYEMVPVLSIKLANFEIGIVRLTDYGKDVASCAGISIKAPRTGHGSV